MAVPIGKGTPRNKTKKRATELPPDPSLPTIKMGPPPRPGPLPKVNYDLVGNVPGKLAAARKQGKNAAGGQLGTISERADRQISKAVGRYDKQANRVTRNIRRIEESNRAYNRGVRRGIDAETKHQTAIAGTARAAGLTGSRSRIAKTMAGVSADVTGSIADQAREMKMAGRGAIKSARKIEYAADKASMSILDVLAAERKSDDIKFIQQLKHEEKMAELQHAQALQLQQLGFEQSLYSMKYQQKLEQDFIGWQLENDLLLTPEQQAALDWRYEKKALQLPYRLEQQKAKRQQEDEQFHNFDVQMSAIEDGIQSAVEWQNSPGKRQAAAAAYPDIPMREAIAQSVMDSISTTLPEGTETAAVKQAINSTLVSTAEGGMAPTFNEVREWIAQTSPDMRSYLDGNPNLENIHSSYRAIRTAQSPAGNSAFTAKAASTGDDSFLDQALGVVAGGGALTASALGVKSLVGAVAEAGARSLGPAATTASGAQLLQAGTTQLGDDAIAGMRNFLSKPGNFQNAVKSALTRAGAANPFKTGAAGVGTGAGESGAVGATVLADLGLVAAAGLVSHKLIDDAATAYQFAEAAEDEALQSTFNLMDATADRIMAGYGSGADLQQIVESEMDNSASHLWSSQTGWTGEQKLMIRERFSVLQNLILRSQQNANSQ